MVASGWGWKHTATLDGVMRYSRHEDGNGNGDDEPGDCEDEFGAVLRRDGRGGGADVDEGDGAGEDADRGREDVRHEADAGEAEGVVDDGEREDGREADEEDDLDPLFGDRLIDGFELGILCCDPLDASPEDGTPEEERDRRGERRADHDDDRPADDPEDRTRADGQYGAGKDQRDERIAERVDDVSHRPRALHVRLKVRQPRANRDQHAGSVVLLCGADALVGAIEYGWAAAGGAATVYFRRRGGPAQTKRAQRRRRQAAHFF